MLTIKCPSADSNMLRIYDKDGRDLTDALGVHSIRIEASLNKEVTADVRLVAIENTDLAEIPGRFLMRNPSTGAFAPIREVQWTDGTTTRFTPDGFVTILPESAAA